MKPSRPIRAILVCALYVAAILWLAAQAGCTSQGGFGSGIFKVWTQRGERAAAKAETKHDAAREAQLEAARLEAEKTAAAADALPPSPEAEITQRFAGNTADLLAQAVPGATAEQLAAVRQLVADLRSQDAAVVAAAEARQAKAEKDNAATSRRLAATATAATRANARASEIAADNAELAADLLWMRAVAIAGSIGTTLLGIAAIMVRLNLGNANGALADVLTTIRAKAPHAAPYATAAADAALSRGQQTKIAQLVASLTSHRTESASA